MCKDGSQGDIYYITENYIIKQIKYEILIFCMVLLLKEVNFM